MKQRKVTKKDIEDLDEEDMMSVDEIIKLHRKRKEAKEDD